jgi:hypothetical protein
MVELVPRTVCSSDILLSQVRNPTSSCEGPISPHGPCRVFRRDVVLFAENRSRFEQQHSKKRLVPQTRACFMHATFILTGHLITVSIFFEKRSDIFSAYEHRRLQ